MDYPKKLIELKEFPVYLANEDESVIYEISESSIVDNTGTYNIATIILRQVNGVHCQFFPRLQITGLFAELFLNGNRLHEVDRGRFELKIKMMSKFLLGYVTE